MNNDMISDYKLNCNWIIQLKKLHLNLKTIQNSVIKFKVAY